MKSISGVVYYVKDLQKTAEFYEGLGFRFGKREADYLTCYLNWFWLEFHVGDNPGADNAGQLVAISVENVDEAYQDLVAKGLKPASEPKNEAWGRREFVLKDPSGYRLVFFEKK